MANRMETLLNKIERRLGTKPLNLPPAICKDTWADVIKEDSIVTFSRYYPNKIRIQIDTSKSKDGYYFIDEAICESVDILGVKDIGWDEFARDSIRLQQNSGYGYYDFLSTGYGMDDIMLLQARADQTSLFNNGIYIDFLPPNRIKLTSTTGADVSRTMEHFPVDLLIVHSPNLMTISPTKMETFEALAIADVASYLYEYLKHYDGLETVFANVDLKLSDIQNKAERRADIVQELKDAYVSPGNDNQPIMITV